jgi:transcriptional regulator with XRE-family HTH domain
MITIRQALKQTQDRYKVRSKDLAEDASIGMQHLASIRHGKSWPSEEVLMRLLEALEIRAPGSQRYFCNLLAARPQDVPEKLEDMSDAALGKLLIEIGNEMARRAHEKISQTTVVGELVKV